ncbi:MAG TPA: hypothetical protein VFD46_14015 [Chryseolinea sp.]|nr:hypothetical protein [Chryseolinea sp.]
MKKLMLFSVWIFFCSCNGFDELEEDNDHQFEATVLDGTYCNYISLEFRPEDAASIERITGHEGYLYYGLQLSKILVHQGQRLRVEIRKLNESDGYVCPTLLPTYPSLTILSLQIVE